MEALGFIAGCFTLLTYVPQAVKTLRTRRTRDLSLSTLLLLCLGAFFWAVFGLGKHLPAVWITNTIVCLLGLSILIVKLQEENT